MRDAVIPLSPSQLYYNFGGSSSEALVMPSLDISMPMNLESFCWDSSNFQPEPPVPPAAAAFHINTPQHSFITSYNSHLEAPTGCGSYSSCDTFSKQSMMMLKKVYSPAPIPCCNSGQVRKRTIEVSSISSKGGKTKKSNTITTSDKTWHQQMKDQFKIQVPARRRQKLSDKITALQKLVSPYGKTDTASVLQEASFYIKLLHKQLQMLSQRSADDLDSNRDEESVGLRSRGLCLVPLCLAENLAHNCGYLEDVVA